MGTSTDSVRDSLDFFSRHIFLTDTVVYRNLRQHLYFFPGLPPVLSMHFHREPIGECFGQK